MAEKKYKRMFTEIEEGLSGVLGDGPFEWVDRRVFDAVFDRLNVDEFVQIDEIRNNRYTRFPDSKRKRSARFPWHR